MIQKSLIFTGIFCLTLYGLFTVQAIQHQGHLVDSFEQMVLEPGSATRVRVLQEGDIVGRLEIPRLNVSVMVMEGVGSRTLRLGAGHIPGTSLPGEGGNAGIAAHRDTFFQELSRIEKNDTITFQTVTGSAAYRVKSTSIVMPDETQVLEPQNKDMITLVTCYPFRNIGPAPKRFIVQAIRE